MIDVKNAVANDHSLACLSMVWHGQQLPWQEFTVDIVPAIPVTQEQLPDVTRQFMSYPHILQDLFVVPKTGTFDQSQSNVVFRLSFSSTERVMFKAMPAALKQGYMLTKVLIDDCITIDDIACGLCSYNLKTATFECFKSETPKWEKLVIEAHKAGPANPEIPEIQNVVRYAQNILQEIERSLVQKHQDSFFLQGCNLIVHSIDDNDYRQMLYVKYCAAVLSDTDETTWQKLAECLAKQLLKSSNMNESYFLHEAETLLDMGLKPQMEIENFCFEILKLGHEEGVRLMMERNACKFQKICIWCKVRLNPTTAMLQFVEDSTKGNLMMHLYVTRSICIHIAL